MSAHPRPRNGVITVIANPATAATHELVAAQATGIKIEVVSLKAISNSANTVTFKSASTAIGPADDLAANGGFVLPFNENGWMRTAGAEALNVTLSAAAKVSIHLQYRLTT